MDRLEFLIFQIVVWTLLLIVVFYILFLVKCQKSQIILKTFKLLADRRKQKNRIRDLEKYKAKIYVRDSSDKFNALLSIFIFLIISFIVLNHYVNFVVVTSNSMSPTLQRGDLVLVQSIDRTPGIGDIIQFQTPSRRMPVLHRVQEVSTTGYTTKGDVSPAPDDWIVNEGQIQAKAVTIFDRPVIIHQIGEFFIAEPRITKFGNEFAFIAGVVNIFRILALIVFLLTFLSLVETLMRH